MTMTDHLIQVATLGIDMRAKQKAYFKTRSREALIASKEAEAEFDKAAAAIMARTNQIEKSIEVIAYKGDVTDEEMLSLLATGKMPEETTR